MYALLKEKFLLDIFMNTVRARKSLRGTPWDMSRFYSDHEQECEKLCSIGLLKNTNKGQYEQTDHGRIFANRIEAAQIRQLND